MLGLKPRCLFALFCDRLPLGLACVLVARRLRLPLLHAPLNALRLGLHLLERRAQIGRLALGLTPLFAARFKLRGQFLDGARERFGSISGLRQLVLELGQPAFGLAQFALQRQRTLAGRLAAGHRGAVEALALRRQEIGMRITQSQPLCIIALSQGSRAAAWAEWLRASGQIRSAL